MFILFSIVMVAIVGAGVYSYVMAQRRTENQDGLFSSDIKVWGLTPLSFLVAILLMFVIFGFFDSYPYQKSISKKNKQFKMLENKLDSLDRELYKMNIRLENINSAEDIGRVTKEKEKKCTQRQGSVIVVVGGSRCGKKSCLSEDANDSLRLYK